MTLIEVRNQFRECLKEQYPIVEIDYYFKRIGGHFFSWDSTLLGLQPHKKLSKREVEKCNEALKDLKKKRPIQYIIGEVFFGNHTLKVDENVLIPRPETQELVDWILNDYAGSIEKKKVLDVGTGSGCIAIALALGNNTFDVSGMDVSSTALKVATLNAEKTKASVRFFEGNIFNTIDWKGTLDLIVSNPPYVTYSECQEMLPNVLEYEPHGALFVEDSTPLKYYEAILNFASVHLVAGGSIYFECNPRFMRQMKQLVLSYENYSCVSKKDAYEKERMLHVLKH